MKYRKKPVIIEARRFTEDNAEQVAAWCNGRLFGGAPTRAVPFIIIPTLEGEMRVDLGSYVICGVDGEFYPCKPDIFEKTYEPVSE